MNPLGPRSKHLLEQFIAFNLEVQAKLEQFRRDLERAGMSRTEAWETSQRLEERILGPVFDFTENALPVEEKVDELIRARLRELDALREPPED
jgi:hypothetical protein